jgi:hypothetical protein
MRSERAQRFRAFVVLYIFSNLAVSGTSVFALKTAGLMWFLFGVLSMAHPQEQEAVQLEREPDQDFHRLHTRWVGSSGSSL